MRKILFRGKRVDNGEWVYGFYFEEIGSFIKEKSGSISTKTHLVVPETVGQYTGLVDKNGIRIFEGDIIANAVVNKWKSVVIAEQLSCDCYITVYGFAAKNGYVDIDDCYVVGNVYDNPELAKERENNG